jgi:hypothetical protein
LLNTSKASGIIMDAYLLVNHQYFGDNFVQIFKFGTILGHFYQSLSFSCFVYVCISMNLIDIMYEEQESYQIN